MGAAASHIDGTGNQLIKAVKAGQVDLVTELISAHPGLLRYQTLRHLNACHFAARAEHADVLQHLFSKAEELEFMERLQGGGHAIEIVRQLANSRSDRGITPLMLAVEKGCAESVKLLLDKVSTQCTYWTASSILWSSDARPLACSELEMGTAHHRTDTVPRSAEQDLVGLAQSNASIVIALVCALCRELTLGLWTSLEAVQLCTMQPGATA